MDSTLVRIALWALGLYYAPTIIQSLPIFQNSKSETTIERARVWPGDFWGSWSQVLLYPQRFISWLQECPLTTCLFRSRRSFFYASLDGSSLYGDVKFQTILTDQFLQMTRKSCLGYQVCLHPSLKIQISKLWACVLLHLLQLLSSIRSTLNGISLPGLWK